MGPGKREFFTTLIVDGAPLKERAEHKNRRAHHADEVVYHGPMLIPERVANAVAGSPGIARTTHGHLVSRYVDAQFTWRFRCQIPEHRGMVGEITYTQSGEFRVHCWAAADERYEHKEEPAAILKRKASRCATENTTIECERI